MQLFTVAFQHPVEFILSTVMAVAIVGIVLAAAMSSDGRARWTRMITGPNGRLTFTVLFIIWAVVFAGALQLVPQEGANTPYGGIGLLGMFTGFFIMMGFIWAVVGE